MRSWIIAAALSLAPITAHAEHQGPLALFPGRAPEQAIDQIEAACGERGFLAKRQSPTDLICQAGDFVRTKGVFRSDKPAMDPRDAAGQFYHRFVAEADDRGAVVKLRSTIVIALPGSRGLAVVDPKLLGARNINQRVREMYLSLGAVLPEGD